MRHIVAVTWQQCYVIRQGKVKVKLKISLEQATKAQRESRGMTLLFL